MSREDKHTLFSHSSIRVDYLVEYDDSIIRQSVPYPRPMYNHSHQDSFFQELLEYTIRNCPEMVRTMTSTA